MAPPAAAPIAWHPEDKKPTRMCRWVVVRDTWRSAERTVLKSWQQWFPKNYPGSSSEGGNDRPFKHTLRFIGEDGIRIEAITEFQGLNSQSISEVLKGSEYSGGWLNETDTHADGALDELEQRLGRYPAPNILLTKDEVAELSRRMGHPLHSGERLASAIGDMNAPTIDNWTYKTLVTNRAPGRGFYIQPSGGRRRRKTASTCPITTTSASSRTRTSTMCGAWLTTSSATPAPASRCTRASIIGATSPARSSLSGRSCPCLSASTPRPTP